MMLDFGEYAFFVWCAYAATAALLAGLVTWSLISHARVKRDLVGLEGRFGRARRSDPANSPVRGVQISESGE